MLRTALIAILMLVSPLSVSAKPLERGKLVEEIMNIIETHEYRYSCAYGNNAKTYCIRLPNPMDDRPVLVSEVSWVQGHLRVEGTVGLDVFGMTYVGLAACSYKITFETGGQAVSREITCSNPLDPFAVAVEKRFEEIALEALKQASSLLKLPIQKNPPANSAGRGSNIANLLFCFIVGFC